MRLKRHTRQAWRSANVPILPTNFNQLRITCLSLLCALVLTACSSADKDDLPSSQAIPADLKPLSSEQIKTALSGNSLYSEDVNEMGQNANAILYHEKSGKIRMRAWGHWGKLTDQGTWDISDAGDYCTKWNGMLARRGKICFKVYQNGDQVYLVPTNTKGKRRIGTLLPGNYLDS
jgi:hypothetical protein